MREVRNEPRPIDLDLLSYDSLCCDVPGLTLPHPRMHERAFVLNPIHEIAPDWVHPRSGEKIADLLPNIPQDQQAFLSVFINFFNR